MSGCNSYIEKKSIILVKNTNYTITIIFLESGHNSYIEKKKYFLLDINKMTNYTIVFFIQ